MKIFRKAAIVVFIGMSSCATPKSYFTVDVRNKVENKAIQVDKLQYYVDRDVELRRELTSGEAKVISGKVRFENGKYIHIIRLKKYTAGVCTHIYKNSLDISFEMGDGKKLTFGVNDNAPSNAVYQIYAESWIDQTSYRRVGRITYDGHVYFIQPWGSDARLMINKSVVDKMQVDKRTMKGRKL